MVDHRQLNEAIETTIRPASPADGHLIEELIRESYPVHAQWSGTLSQALLPDPGLASSKISTFMAFVEEQEKPVGMASTFYFPDRPLVFFGSASVRTTYRRKGIYSSLVAHRLAVAKQNGARAAVIQAAAAAEDACKKLGFMKFCEIDFYTWNQEVRNSDRQ